MKALLSLKPYILKYKWRFLWGIFFIFMVNLVMVRIPVEVGRAVNEMTHREGLLLDLAWAAVYIVALAGIGGAFRYLMRRVLIDTSRDVEFDFRNHMYRKLQSLDATFYDENNTGDIMSRMTNDIDAMRMMIGPAIMLTANSLFSLPIVVGQMMVLDWMSALVGLAPLLILPPIVRHFSKTLHKKFRAQQDQLGDLTTYCQESIAGIRVLKAYGQEESSYAQFDEENRKYIDRTMDLVRVQAYFFPGIRLFAGSGLLLILLVGSRRIISGEMEFGTLLSQILLFQMIVFPMVAAGFVLNMFQRAAAALERIGEIENAQSLVDDLPAAVKVEEIPPSLDVEFRDLTFAYRKAGDPVLRDISLNVPAGRIVGIVGRVGAGKSTLIHLLLRLYPVERGRLLIGGIDINDWPVRELRRRVGIVYQETFLFSETLADNIRFGALESLTDEQVEKAAEKADVHKDIVEFPDQYATMLGERGINLSGGQKQRVSLARTMVRDASILILDDSLSAVDTHTEEAILKSLRKEMQGRTTFLISHRISTIAFADQIIVLEQGRITQQGTHEELVRQDGLYGELYRRQLLEEEVEEIG